jgi:ABC-2 type transport system permease protein
MSWLTIALKDLRLIARDRAALAFTILVPVAVVTIVAATLGGRTAGTIVLPVVNEDRGPVAEVLLEALREHVEVVEVGREAGEAMVGRDNDAAAVLVLPERLSKRYLANRPTDLLLLTDPAKGAEVNVIKAYLLVAQRDAQALADPFFEPLLALDERNVTGKRLTTDAVEQNVTGFSVMFVLMSVFFGVAFGLQDERDWGVITRLRIAPLSHASFLAGKLLARFVVSTLQMLLLFVFGHFVFGVPLGSPAAFVVLACAVVFSLTGFSLLVAPFAGTREQIIPLGLTVIMLVCSIGGCWWPLFMEPLWLRNVAHVAPTAWAMEGLHDLMLRDRGLVGLAPTLGVLVAYGLGCAVIGAHLHRSRF